MSPAGPAHGRAAWRAWLADQVPDPESRRYRFGAGVRATAQSAAQALRSLEQRTHVRPGAAETTRHRVVTYRGRRIPAAVAVSASTDGRHLAAAAAVTEALTSAGVAHFAYTDSATRIRFGVGARDRGAALSALHRWSRLHDTPMVRATGSADRLEADPISAAARRPAPTEIIGLPVVDAGERLVLGVGAGVPLDWWHVESAERIGTPVANRWAASLPQSAREPARLDFRGLSLPSFAPLTDAHVDDVRFEVDAVVAWVDGSDPAWRQRYTAAGGAALSDDRQTSRYWALDEVRFVLRSLAAFGSWIRHVYLVTDQQVPSWLTPGPGLSVVDHRDIWADPTALPVFNSHAIEARLHHIDGLADHWLYLNDDMFFGRASLPEQYFAGNGAARFFAAPLHVGLGEPGPDEGTPSLAGRNNQRLLRQATGTVPTLKLHHAPYPQRTAVARAAEAAFPSQYERTARSRFRSSEDVSAITLQTWYGWATGKFLPGPLRQRYFDLRTDRLEAKLRFLLRHRHLDAFCLNMGEEEGSALANNAGLATAFLPRYFPFVSPWEAN